MTLPSTDFQSDNPVVTHYDGVICFGGEDWWYHNRGHYDMQMMRHFASALPVVYVNSIGMRFPAPTEGRMFFKRIGRKLASLARGHVLVGDKMSVMSAPTIPTRLGVSLTRRLLVRAVRRAARERGITRPLIWVACPTAASIIDELDPAAVVYQRTDRYERFPGVDEARVSAQDSWLKSRADLTVFCSSFLHLTEAESCRRATVIDHGVDLARFAAAGDRVDAPEPEGFAGMPRPRVGFIGGIDSHTFDSDLFCGVAKQLPGMQFAMIGACSLPDGWCADLPNVSLLGQRPFEDVADCMAACDVLIMPWRRSEWIRGCNPVKLKEYLAVGRPIISTPFPELDRYQGNVRMAETADEFAEAIRAALTHDPRVNEAGRKRVTNASWNVRAESALAALALERRFPVGDADAGLRLPTPEMLVDDPAKPVIVEQKIPEPKIAPEPERLAAPRRAVDDARFPAEIVLLSGGLRPSPLSRDTGLPALDLWITDTATLLDHWVSRIRALDRGEALPIRVIHDAVVPATWAGGVADGDAHLTIEQQPQSWRGPAGLARDASDRLDHTQHILLAESARYVTRGLDEFIDEHQRTDADVSIAVNPDQTPAGLYLVRVGALDLVPTTGFHDMKEQFLRRAAEEGLELRVFELPEPGSMPIRTRPQYIAALRRIAGQEPAETPVCLDGAPADPDSSVVVTAPGAQIAPDAIVTDSVLLPGAVVDGKSAVARSVVCSHTRVQPGTDIADAILNDDAFSEPSRQHGASPQGNLSW